MEWFLVFAVITLLLWYLATYQRFFDSVFYYGYVTLTSIVFITLILSINSVNQESAPILFANDYFIPVTLLIIGAYITLGVIFLFQKKRKDSKKLFIQGFLLLVIFLVFFGTINLLADSTGCDFGCSIPYTPSAP